MRQDALFLVEENPKAQSALKRAWKELEIFGLVVEENPKAQSALKLT